MGGYRKGRKAREVRVAMAWELVDRSRDAKICIRHLMQHHVMDVWGSIGRNWPHGGL
jgi:hypothetical protein